MAPIHGKCSGCRNVIQNKEFLECAVCKMKYDISCAGVSSNRFFSFYAQDLDRKRNWKCPECCSKQPKTGNTNTPVRQNPSEIGALDSLDLQPDNVTVRTKRDQGKSFSPDDCSPEKPTSGNEYVTETTLRSKLKQELKGALQTTIRELVSAQIKQMSDLLHDMNESFTFFNKQYEDLKSDLAERNALIDDLKKDNQRLNQTVCDLTNRLHVVEQNMRDSNIEVNGIPEHRQENLPKIIEQLVNVVKAPVSPDDILHATRVAKLNKDTNRPRAVVVKLRAPKQRDAILGHVSAFNKKNEKEKLSSQHLGLAGTSKPIFVAEHLSPSNKALHAATRIRAKEHKYKFTWVRNGRIFTRKNEFSEALLIRNMDSLSLIK